MNGQVLSVNISRKKGTMKKPVSSITLNQLGIEGDAHAGKWHRQVSLLSQENIDTFSKKNLSRNYSPGEFAENITTKGLDLSKIAILDLITIGDLQLKVSQIGKKCHGDGCAIYKEVGKCVMPKEGIFAIVIKDGTIKAGDKIIHSPRALRCQVITLSDRANAGEYDDLSGPKISSMIDQHFAGTRWHLETKNTIIPDEEQQLRDLIAKATNTDIDIIITTGGTGIGSRDITPEVISSICDKMIPGIMDHIRLKYGAKIPNALISRSVAGITGKTLIFALPGSVKAVSEYMTEILKPLEHMILMVHDLGH